MKNLRSLGLCLVLFFVLLLSACQTTTGYYLGALADSEGIKEITPVLDAEQQWEDFFLTVNSRLTRQDDLYQMSGWLSFSPHTRTVYVRVADVELTLFMLDADNRVIDYRRVIFLRGLDPQDRLPFSLELPVTAAAVAYSFGYQVVLIDDEGASSVNWDFPRTRH